MASVAEGYLEKRKYIAFIFWRENKKGKRLLDPTLSSGTYLRENNGRWYSGIKRLKNAVLLYIQVPIQFNLWRYKYQTYNIFTLALYTMVHIFYFSM